MTPAYDEMLLADFYCRDDLQDVSLTNAVTGVIVTEVKAKVRGLNYKEAALSSDLGLEPTDQVFVLGCTSLGAAIPNRGDKITNADGTTWTVISDVMRSFSNTPIFYEVIARRQS